MRMLDSILLATDFRASSAKAAETAVELTAKFGARVTIFHVLEMFPTWPESPQENQERLLADLKARNVDVANLLIGVGPPADTVVQKARELKSDLLLVGAGEKFQDGRLTLGPIAMSIIEHADAPVLAVHPHQPGPGFRTILCPVDHSPISRLGLEHAVQLARAFAAKLIVLSVVPEVGWLKAAVETGTFDEPKMTYESRWIAEFDQFLAGVPFDGVAWQREVHQGVPHEKIIAAVRQHQADLLVMGATGRTGLVRVLLGSVTRRVLHDLPCSLLTVKEGELTDLRFDEHLNEIQRLMGEARDLLAAQNATSAAAHFRRVLARNPFHLPALEGLAEACGKLGQREEVRQLRQRIERLRAAR